MEILFHTIAVEPARWAPARVTQPLAGLLPALAERGFRRLEIFEPHLQDEAEWPALVTQMTMFAQEAVILSSYLNLSPHATSDAEITGQTARLQRCLNAFGIRQVRLFPGHGISPGDHAQIAVFAQRLRALAGVLPGVVLLLETHDDSIADEPAALVRLVEELAIPQLGLLYQPTIFERESALAQFRLQKHLIRHVHLQNRVSATDPSFAPLAQGHIPWPEILSELTPAVNLTIEFLPAGMCAPAEFDLAATLDEAVADLAYVRQLVPGAS